MTAYYIDSVAGSDSNAGTSAGAPWATMDKPWLASVWSAGNIFYLKRGSTFTSTCAPRGSGTIASPILVTNYGPAEDPLPICANASGQGFDLVTYSGIILDGLDIRGVANGVGWSLYTGTAAGSVIVRRCRITATDMGIYFRAGAGGAGSLAGAIIEDNDIYNTGNHGILVDGGLSAFIVRRNRIRNCGRTVASHGISVNQPNYTTNLTWTLLSGNVYQATITGATHMPSFPTATSIDSVYIVFAATRWALMEDAVTAPASLASGRYRYTGGVLYVNCGGNNPTSATSFDMTYGGQRSWVISDNIITGQKQVGGAEGASIQADDRATYGTITRNYCESATPAGAILGNGSSSITITSNVVKVGGAAGIAVSGYGNTCDINNNTIILAGGSGNAIEMWGSNAGGTRKANNNVIKGASTHAISDYFGAGATYEIKNNCIYGTTDFTDTGGNLTTGNFIATVSADPQLAHDYMPRNATLWTAGLALGYTDRYGITFVNTIGAVQYQSAQATAAYPKFLHDNRLLDATPTASTTATGYNVVNLTDLRPYSFWQPTALPATVTVDCGIATAADFAAICGHDLYDTNCTVEIRASTDNFSASDVLIVKRVPLSNEPFILPFASASYRYWRIKITGTDFPTIAIAIIGVALPLPRRHQIGFDPTARTAKSMVNRSVGGYPLGKVTAYEEWSQQISIDVVTWAWIRDTWTPAWKAYLRDDPFLYAWDSTDHPREVYLVTSGDAFKTPTISGNYAGLEFTLTGVANP